MGLALEATLKLHQLDQAWLAAPFGNWVRQPDKQKDRDTSHTVQWYVIGHQWFDSFDTFILHVKKFVIFYFMFGIYWELQLPS